MFASWLVFWAFLPILLFLTSFLLPWRRAFPLDGVRPFSPEAVGRRFFFFFFFFFLAMSPRSIA